MVFCFLAIYYALEVRNRGKELASGEDTSAVETKTNVAFGTPHDHFRMKSVKKRKTYKRYIQKSPIMWKMIQNVEESHLVDS